MSIFNEGSDNFSFASSSLRTPNRSSFMNAPGDSDFESEDQNSSLTEIFTTKNDLKVKYSAVLQNKKDLENKIEKLKQGIMEMNSKGDISLRVLDEKKDALTKEHDRLERLLNSLPTIDFLNEQARILSNIVDEKIIADSPSSFLDTQELQELGILNKNESLAILQQRLKQMVSRLNELLALGKHDTTFSFNENFQYDNSYESNELKKRIKIIKDMSPISSGLAQCQCEQLEDEISDLRDEIRKLKEKQETEKNDPVISIEDIKKKVEAAGGDANKLTCIRGCLYRYMSTLFRVEYRFKRLYAITDTTELPIIMFIKTLIPSDKIFRTPKKRNSLH